MASYKVNMPDGSSYKVTLPDQAAPEEDMTASQKLDAAVNSPYSAGGVMAGGAERFMSNIGDLESSLAAKAKDTFTGTKDATKAYEQSPERAATQNLNTRQDADIANMNKATGGTKHIPFVGDVGMGNVASFAGEFVPLMAGGGALAKGAGAVAEAASVGGSAATKVVAPFLARSEALGQTAAVGTPNNAPTVDKTLEQAGNNAKVAAVAAPAMDAGFRIPSWLATGAKKASARFTKSGAEESVGKELNSYLDEPGKQKLAEYTAPGPQQDKLTTAAVTQNPDIAAKERAITSTSFKDAEGNQVNPATSFTRQKEASNDRLANEIGSIAPDNANPQALGHTATDIVNQAKEKLDRDFTQQAVPETTKAGVKMPSAVDNAPSITKANENLHGYAKATMLAERNAVKRNYDNIAPDNTVEAPVQKVTSAIEKLEDDANTRSLIHGDPEVKNSADPVLKPIVDRYSSENAEGLAAVPVKQQIADKNALGNYVDDLYDSLEGNTNPTLVKQKIEVAKNLQKSISTNLKATSDVPSAIEGKSVGEAFSDAEKSHSDWRAKYTTNPDTYSVLTQDGESHIQSKSALGRLYQRLKTGSEAAPGTEGGRLLDPTKPAEFRSSIQNIKHVEGSDQLIKDNILSHVKDAKDFDKIYTPDIAESVAEHSPKVHAELTAIREELELNKVNAAQANLVGETAAKDAKTSNEVLAQAKAKAQAELEQSLAYKMLDENGTALPPEQQVEHVLASPQSKQEAIAMAKAQNDGGATTRGLGKSVLDKIVKDNTVEYRNIDGKPAKTIDLEGLEAAIKEHGDILGQTIPDELKKVQDAAKVVQKVNYSRSDASLEGRSTSPDEAATSVEKGALGGFLAKFGVPASVGNQAVNAVGKVSNNREKAVLAKALSDPQYAQKLIDRANSPEVAGLYKTLQDMGIGSVLGVKYTVKGNSKPQKKLDSEVNKVYTKPATEKRSSLDNELSIISNANADDSVPAASKKNIEPQVDLTSIAKKTGISEDYLKGVEKHEIRGQADPDKARPIDSRTGKPRSTAFGRGQFLEASWNDLAKKHSLPPVTDANRYTKDDPRADASTSRLATAYYASDNADAMKPWLKREPTQADTYGAHLMGLTGFKSFMTAKPSSIAANLLPAAAKNNEGLFYKNGEALTVRQVYRNLEKAFPNLNIDHEG